MLLLEEGVLSLKDLYVDGTKIEAVINQINEALQGKNIDKKLKQKTVLLKNYTDTKSKIAMHITLKSIV